MKTKYRFAAILCVLYTVISVDPAHADELWLGVTAHEVDTPFTLKIQEGGRDVQAGWRGDRIEALGFLGKPSPHVLVSVSINGETNLAAAGLSWKLGDKFYVRPGIGIAIHDGPITRVGPLLSNGNRRRTDLGSRILFEPEIAAGIKLTPRLAAEGSWVHVSHARLFSGQNPGLDLIGVRLVLKVG
jgi:lipid A 3-O-deacylase